MFDGLILSLSKEEFREWLLENNSKAKECFVKISRSKDCPKGCLNYLDALEEALCFGWIDSVIYPSHEECCCIQRFSPRIKNSKWTELNKARVRRLIKLGLMHESGLKAFKNVKEFYIDEDIQAAFENNKIAYYNFKKMPILYQKVRIDTIQRYKKNRETFERRLKKLIDNCEKNILFGEWNDNGKLIE